MNANPVRSSIPTLVIFCRRPSPGRGKQRIAATIGPGLTFELATHLLHATLEDAASWPGPVVIAPAAQADQGWAEALMTGNHSVCPQPGGNLGERLNAVDCTIRSTGSEQLIYIGSDAPILDEAYFEQARAALQTHDVVLGAAEDGGVVLMGARCAWPDLAPLPWSGNDLGKQLELLCLQNGLTVKYLPTRYDIDFASDLPRLHADLRTDTRPARLALHDWLATAGFASNNVT
jgi:rSAM/selenodomain-associated transferase 1